MNLLCLKNFNIKKKECLFLFSFIIAFQMQLSFADPVAIKEGLQGKNWSIEYKEPPIADLSFFNDGLMNILKAVKESRKRPFKDIPPQVIEEAFQLTGVIFGSNSGFCHGTFISQDLFLTAAHCVENIFKDYNRVKNTTKDFCEKAEQIDIKDNNFAYVSNFYRNQNGNIAARAYEVEGVYFNNKYVEKERIQNNPLIYNIKLFLDIETKGDYVQYDQALVKLRTPIYRYSIRPNFKGVNTRRDQCFVTDWRDLSDSVIGYQQMELELLGILQGQERKYSDKYAIKLQRLKDVGKEVFHEDKKTYFFTGEKSNIQSGYSGGPLWCYNQDRKDLSFHGVAHGIDVFTKTTVLSIFSSFNEESGRWLQKAQKSFDSKNHLKYRPKVKCDKKQYKKIFS